MRGRCNGKGGKSNIFRAFNFLCIANIFSSRNVDVYLNEALIQVSRSRKGSL